MKVTRYGVEIDLSHEMKVACPRCVVKFGRDKTGDNLQVYGINTEGKHCGAFCWSCSYTIPSEEWLEENGDGSEAEYYEDIMGLPFDEDVNEKIKSITGVDSKNYRSIRVDTSKYFGVRYQYNEVDGSVSKTLYPITKSGELSGYKVREHPKKFSTPYGDVGKDCDLFMQFRFKTHKDTVVICAGEIDSLSMYQVLLDNQKNKSYNSTAVVSPTIGESGAAGQVQLQYEFFNQFKKIIVAFDNDKAGREATEKVCQVLPRGKAHVMPIRYKDINEYLEKGKENELISDFWASKPWTPSGVHASSSLYDAALDYTNITRLSLPHFLKRMSDMFGNGLVKNELNVIFSSTSQGKSLYVDSLITHWVDNELDEVVGVMSLEAAKEKYATNILSRFLEVNLNAMSGEERREFLSNEEVRAKADKHLKRESGEPTFYVYDNRGAKLEDAKESILEMIIRLGVTILVVDPYSDLMAGCSLEEQENFIAWMKSLILEYQKLSVVLVCHTRKLGAGSYATELTENDIMGSSTVMKSAAQTFSIQRDKLHENPVMRNVTKVVIHKNRHAGDTGLACEVFYDYKTGKLHDLEDYKKDNPWIINQLEADGE